MSLAAGVSGNPASPHWNDQTDGFLGRAEPARAGPGRLAHPHAAVAGRYHPAMPESRGRKKAKKAKGQRYQLEPQRKKQVRQSPDGSRR